MPGPESPEAAEAAFYRAFEARDLDAMLAVWAEDDDIVCIHPGGPLLRGRPAIARSFAAILTQGPELSFVVQNSQRIGNGELAIHVVTEHVFEEGVAHGPIFATNVFRYTGSGWRMVIHHAAPAPAPSRPMHSVGPIH